jgi:3-dehydroquinate synthase
MLKSFSINSKIKNYKIIFSNKYPINNYKNSVVIIDNNLKNFFNKKNNFIYISSKEKSKSYEQINKILKKFLEFGVNKQFTIVAIGGGIIQDIACFISTIYMRGLDWIYLPTTFLAMTDSCIGGKSSININKAKNIIGTYNPPSKVIIDLNFLNSLSDYHLAEGTIEAAKIMYVNNSFHKINFFINQINTKNIKKIDKKYFYKLIHLSLFNKKKIIEKDEFDKKDRLLLNFGHTFGHAIETATKFKISHGIGVGIGIIFALRFSKIYFNRPPLKLENNLFNFVYSLLIKIPRINYLIKSTNIRIFLKVLLKDKKHNKDYFRFILTNKKGKLSITKIKKDGLNLFNFSNKIFDNFLKNEI